MQLDHWASRHAEELLAPLGKRWLHTQSVVHRASEVQVFFPKAERELLVAAAYLHDVGYAPELARSGFHPLDGALHLEDLGQRRLASLVAHHSASKTEAGLRSLASDLARFEEELSDTALVLTYCDLTVGRAGNAVTLDERFADLDRQYGDQNVATRAVRLAWPVLRHCVEEVERRLAGARLAKVSQ